MKKDIAERWVKALRSGEYKQTNGDLKNEAGFCCLGVLCDLANKDGVGEWRQNNFGTYMNFTDGSEFAGNMLPLFVMNWAGMNSEEGSLGKEISPLWRMNDHEDKSFSDIADIIEQNVDVL